MPHKKIPQRELAGFVAELERVGAREIRHAPVDVRGRVKVRWKPSLAEEEEYRAGVQAWKGSYVVHAIALAIFIAALVVLAL